MKPRTLFEKLWDAHQVSPPVDDEGPAVIYVDLHLIHEVTSPQAFAELNARGLSLRRPDRTKATVDHIVPTTSLARGAMGPKVLHLIDDLEANCRKHGVELLGLESEYRGIVHVIGPEVGLTQPGMTIVCGDSHTSTHGAFGAWAFGIGSTEVGHVLATQCVLLKKPSTFAVELNGSLPEGVTSKDVALAFIARIGMDGATGHVLEFRGGLIAGLDMEARMTLCNMSIEAGARAGMVGVDETTLEYVAKTPRAPKGAAWRQAASQWRTMRSDEGATFDRAISMDVAQLSPRVTYGTSPDMSIAIDDTIPTPTSPASEQALRYMGLEPGKRLLGQPLDAVFIGSCTNSRLSDLKAAAALLRGARVKTRTLVVPGSENVRRLAEREGLHHVFTEAGAEWRLPGCSMCIAINGDELSPGQYALSTSNRNFEGRQGQGGRTILGSPLTAAASAIEGRVADPRRYLDAAGT